MAYIIRPEDDPYIAYAKQLSNHCYYISPLSRHEQESIFVCVSGYQCPEENLAGISAVFEEPLSDLNISATCPADGQELTEDRVTLHAILVLLEKLEQNAHRFQELQKTLRIRIKCRWFVRGCNNRACDVEGGFFADQPDLNRMQDRPFDLHRDLLYNILPRIARLDWFMEFLFSYYEVLKPMRLYAVARLGRLDGAALSLARAGAAPRDDSSPPDWYQSGMDAANKYARDRERYSRFVVNGRRPWLDAHTETPLW